MNKNTPPEAAKWLPREGCFSVVIFVVIFMLNPPFL